MPKIYIDIETVRSQRADIMQHLMGKLAKTVDVNDFDAVETELQRLHERTSLQGQFGEIVSIAAAIDDRPPKAWWRNLPTVKPAPRTQPDNAMLTAGEHKTERALLLAFREDVRTVTMAAREPLQVIGINVREFDLPFIWQRGFANRLLMPNIITREVKPWEHHLLKELMTVWTGTHREKISMNDLAYALGLPGKGDTTGKDVWQLMREGRGEEVAIYNCDDVGRTRDIDVAITNLE